MLAAFLNAAKAKKAADESNQKETANKQKDVLTKNKAVIITAGVPIREGLQDMYTIFRDKAYKEFIIFLVFYVIFIAVTISQHTFDTAFQTDMALIDRFIDEEFPDASYKKNFEEIMTMGEFWEWVQGPFFEGVYENKWYNDRPFNEFEKGMLLNYFRVAGPIQFRQNRVSNSSCRTRRFLTFGKERSCADGPWNLCQYDEPGGTDGSGRNTNQTVWVGRYDTKDGTCFAEFSVAQEDKEAFRGMQTDQLYEYYEGLDVVEGLTGYGVNYGTGGFVKTLPAGYGDDDRRQAYQILEDMKSDLFLNKGTRLVAITMNLYNTNTRYLTSIRFTFQFFSNGHIVKNYRFYSVRIVLYESFTDQIRVLGEVLIVLGWVYYVQKEIRRFHRSRPKISYFSSFRNVFELLFLSMLLGCIVMWAIFITDSRLSTFDVNVREYQPLFDLASFYMDVFNLAGFTGLVGSLKVFVFLGISKRMNALWLTMQRAASDFLAFSVGFGVIVWGFAIAGHYLFGFMLEDFKNIPTAFSTLIRFPLGDFKYDELFYARPGLAVIFFGLYVIMVFIVCLNMFIGILNKYFEEVHDELKISDWWKTTVPPISASIRIAYLRCINRCCGCCPNRVRGNFDPAYQKARRMWLSTLHMAMRAARRNNKTDLFRLFERMYNENTSPDSMWMSLHELCCLTKAEPCDFDRHKANDCVAFQVCSGYAQWKNTLLMEAEQHTEVASVVADKLTHGKLSEFIDVAVLDVVKGEKKRDFGVDKEEGLLLVFGKTKSHGKKVLRRRFPLQQLMQMETITTDVGIYLRLIFTSQGIRKVSKKHMARVESLKGLEVTLELRFDPHQARRFDSMKNCILEARANVTASKKNKTSETGRLRSGTTLGNATAAGPPTRGRKATGSRGSRWNGIGQGDVHERIDLLEKKLFQRLDAMERALRT